MINIATEGRLLQVKSKSWERVHKFGTIGNDGDEKFISYNNGAFLTKQHSEVLRTNASARQNT